MKKITLLFAFLTLLTWQVNAQITTYPYTEDFESGSGGWVADNTTNGTWALGTPAATIINSAASGANSWATNLTGNYNASENSWVTSPVFDFSSLNAPSIQLNVWWNAEFSWDGMVLQSSIDNGVSWQNVGTVGDPNNWYTDNTINGNPGGQQEGWSGRNSSSNGSGAWILASHPLTGLNGQSNVLLRIAFGSDGSVHDEGVAFDDIYIFEVLCPQPSTLSASNILTTSADLAWIETATATAWDIEWGTSGFTLGTGTLVTGSTTNPHSLTGLTPITNYDFYVRASCGAGNGVSVWSGPYTFITACATVPAPWLDDIEAHTPTTTLGLSNCWSASATAAYTWNIDGAGSTPSTGTGPTGAFSGTNYFYTEASSGVAGDRAILLSPTIDLTPLTVPVLQFYYHMFGTVVGDLSISVFDGSTWTSVGLISGQQQTAQADPWIKSLINLSAFSGSSIQIKFSATSAGTIAGDISLDNIEVIEAPTCIDPSILTASNITATSADLGWTENGTATAWDIEWGTTGFAPTGTPNVTGTTTNPHNLTGLAPITTYDFYVRADCGGANGVSTWTGPFTFITACATLVTPWIDDIETHTPTTTLDTSNCWYTTSTSSYDWNIDGAGSTPSSNTGPNGAFSGTNYFYTEASGAGAADTANLVSPSVDLTALTVPLLEFYYHMTGAQMGSLFVDVWNGSTWAAVDSIIGQQQATQADLWIKRSVNLSAFTSTVQIRFRAISNGSFEGDISIDNIEILETPACPAPSFLTVANITTSSADLGWTENGTATTWDIELGTAGFAPTGTPTITGTTTNPHNLTGLTPATSYDFYVRADCGGSGASTWVGPLSFTTLCTTASLTYTQDFTTWPMVCWDLTGGSQSWGDNGGIAEASFWSWTNPNNSIMTSEPINISVDARVKFDWSHLYNATYPLDSLSVDVKVLPSGTWTSIWAKGGIDLESNDGAGSTTPGSMVNATIYLTPATYTGQNIQIRFHATSGYGPDLFVDNLVIEPLPSCPEPSQLTAANITATSADLGWTENGSATSWEIEWGTTGFVQGAGTSVITGTNPYSLTGLTTVTSYDFYVRAICGAGDSSIWVGPFSFTTTISCPAPTVQTVTNITATSVDLGWTENGSATTWNIEWGAGGFAQGTGTSVITTTNPHNLTGLTASTAYDFYVRAVCGAGDSSTWIGPFSFNTLCVPVSAPWLDDVEAHAATTTLTNSICWSTTATGAYGWDISGSGTTPSTATGPLAAHSGTNFFFTEASSGASGNVAELISPAIDLTPLSTPSVEFYYHMFGNSSGEMGNLFVDIWDGSSWTTVDSIMGQQQTAQADSFLLKVVDISTYTGTIQVKFRAISAGTFHGDISLDNIEVRESSLITCATPNNLTTSIISSTAADLGWIEVGTATNWEIEWGAAGFVQGTGTTVITTTNPHSLTGLTGATSYDFYVRAICGTADTSSWSSVNTFSTFNVGINSYSENINLNVYPNPNNGLFTLNINTTNVNELEIKITNLQGQVIYSKNNFDNVSNVNEQVNLSSNARGIYFVNVTSDKGIITHKLIVQ